MLQQLILPTVVAVLMLSGCRADRTPGARDRRELASYAFFSPQRVPSEVREEMTARFPAAEITGVGKKTFKDGSVEYEVEFVDGGRKREARVPDRSSPTTGG